MLSLFMLCRAVLVKTVQNARGICLRYVREGIILVLVKTDSMLPTPQLMLGVLFSSQQVRTDDEELLLRHKYQF